MINKLKSRLQRQKRRQEERSPPGMFLRELPLSLHVEHEITAVYVLNNKEKSVKRFLKKDKI